MFGRLIFFVCALLLAFIYGLATVQFEIFPYEIIRQAKNGFEAYKLLEDESHQVSIKNWGGEAGATPAITKYSPAAGQERLLVTGGFYQYMDKCPTHGCLAWITDRDGKVLHTWETDPVALFDGATGFTGELSPMNVYPIGMKLGADGNLTVSFHGRNIFPYTIGLAQFAPDGKLLWKKWDHSHHWIDVDKDGQVYAPSQRAIEMTGNFTGTFIGTRCPAGKINDEGIRVYSPDGSVVRDLWINESFIKSNWPGFIYSNPDGCDPGHINSAEVVTDAIAGQLPGVDAGDLLISVREPSLVAILGGQDGAIKYAVAGRTAAQHGPQFLPEGSVVVFDNRGGDPALGGTRILRIDMQTGAANTVFPQGTSGPAIPFSSHDGGHVAVSPDGKRVMVASKQQSRIFEFDVESGEVLWEMAHCMNMTPYLQKLGREEKASNACFRTYGAYYLENVPFLPAASQ